jgi:thioesterase domain-containing protein
VTKQTGKLISELENKLHREIPLTRQMGLCIKEYDAAGLTLSFPFAPNVNHIGSVFGGSLAAAVTLAGWCYTWSYLTEHAVKAHLLIQESHISYLQPVTGDFLARCHAPSQKALHSLMAMLQRKGKGRISLNCEVLQKDAVAVRFHGTYAVLAKMA